SGKTKSKASPRVAEPGFEFAVASEGSLAGADGLKLNGLGGVHEWDRRWSEAAWGVEEGQLVGVSGEGSGVEFRARLKHRGGDFEFAQTLEDALKRDAAGVRLGFELFHPDALALQHAAAFGIGIHAEDKNIGGGGLDEARVERQAQGGVEHYAEQGAAAR